LSGEQPGSLFERAAEALRDRGAAIVSVEVVGVPYDNGKGPERLAQAFGPVAWPVTWIDRRPDVAMGGVHIWAIVGPTPTPIVQGSVVTGTRFEDTWATFCRVGGLAPADIEAAPADQASSILHAMETTLHAADMGFADVVRTWFFNRDISAWYGDFNQARNRFFASRGVFQGVVPASTGVGGGDVGAAALTGGLLAIRPKNGLAHIVPAFSPLQCPALDYGSAFNRAIEVAFPDHVRLLVSGTASISPHGHTEHAGNVEAQVTRTVDVVGALLESRGTAWDEVTSGLAYVKRIDDLPAVTGHLERAQLDRLPILMVHADICRNDLLFELEVNVISPRARYNHGPG
jgi:enamine deaminase RidA (YjgF/YER057c/UK114 family)